MHRRFATLDVFTRTRFAGNPLAVVLEADGLDAEAMQRIAREFNLSETVFVFPPATPAHRARLRIFTPARELPFAGHPTVGTAVLLAGLDGQHAAPAFVLEETIGPVQCRVHAAGQEAARAEFDVPTLPHREPWSADRPTIAAALGLAATDLSRDDRPAERWSAGNPFSVVPILGLEAMRRCRVDLAAFDAAFGGDGHAAAFLFCRETAGAGHDVHARMFAPSMGVLEDPATGSAAAAFAGYLAVHGHYLDGEHLVRIEQGLEMNRPSNIELTLTIRGGVLVGAAIGGQAVVVSRGTIDA